MGFNQSFSFPVACARSVGSLLSQKGAAMKCRTAVSVICGQFCLLMERSSKKPFIWIANVSGPIAGLVLLQERILFLLCQTRENALLITLLNPGSVQIGQEGLVPWAWGFQSRLFKLYTSGQLSRAKIESLDSIVYSAKEREDRLAGAVQQNSRSVLGENEPFQRVWR